ncbi:hypothetical protein Acr_00g0080520 [Actinidia rufa]|uniref:Uncharacterized protein n=1 Tax=Actinidia rufa TaxID=165716 RepID=A0A7J0DWJ0_9ERIC|nr:hypothetical protein Acr_00g0080520 [Actinidia rufa]
MSPWWVTVTDFARDLDTSLALARAIMLCSDSTALADESWDLMRNLLVMQHVQSLQRAMATVDRMAEYSAELKQTKKKMEADANKAKLALTDVIQLKADLVLAEQSSVNPGRPRSRVPWVSRAYSPLILPDFDEEEFLNKVEENEVAPEPVPDFSVAPNIEVVDSAEEVGKAVAEAPGDRSTEETGADDGEDAD